MSPFFIREILPKYEIKNEAIFEGLNFPNVHKKEK
jgi:hypothetical protein